jgi:hypothetical protein
MPSVPSYPHFLALMEDFVLPLKASLPPGAIRLDGLVGVETPHWRMAEFEFEGATWAVAGDTRFEPLEIALRAVRQDPGRAPFTVGLAKTQRKLELRPDLRAVQGGRAAYLYVYSPLTRDDRSADIEVSPAQPAPRLPSVPRATVAGATDLEQLLAHADVLGPPHAWEEPLTYLSIPLAIIDSVWSIGVNYAGVTNVIARHRSARAAAGRDADADTTSDFLRFISDVGGPVEYSVLVQNRQRTSSRSGILKAEAVQFEAEVVASAGVETPDDLRDLPRDALKSLRSKWTSTVPGQSSGLSWDYFLMLCAMPGVKADRMVIRFVADALGLEEADIAAGRASQLVSDAAQALGVDPRFLDYAIWLHQRAA